MNKRVLNIGLAVVLLLLSAVACVLTYVSNEPQSKYLFYFIGDGMGQNHILATEQYNAAVAGRKEIVPLCFSEFPVHTFVTSYSATNLVTDSAAAGTALATGVKTANTYIGVDAEGVPHRSIAEAAIEEGYAVGLVSNVGINHATPSAFYGHLNDRFGFAKLVDSYIATDIAFIAGSTIMRGKNNSDGSVTANAGVTTASLAAKVREAGITVTTDPAEAAEATGRVMLLASDTKDQHIPYAIDRKSDKHSLVSFTKAAVANLEKRGSKKGFFLMVEGGKLDYAAHEHDAVATFHEVNEFAECVAVAVEFARRHPKETLIVVTADHETGGMSLGWDNYEVRMEKFLGQKCSALALTAEIQKMRDEGKRDWAEYKQVISERLGLWSRVEVTKEEERELRNSFDNIFMKQGPMVDGLYNKNEHLVYLAIRILSRHASLEWTSMLHTSAHTPLYVTGVGAERFFECRDNTDIPKTIATLILSQPL